MGAGVDEETKGEGGGGGTEEVHRSGGGGGGGGGIGLTFEGCRRLGGKGAFGLDFGEMTVDDSP